MAITIYTEPSEYTGAYSPIPLRFSSTNVNEENFKYVVSISYNARVGSSHSTSLINNNVYTKITTSVSHVFETGDFVLFENDTEGNTGLYNVISTPANNEVVIDLQLVSPIVSSTRISKVIKYSLPPDMNGEATLNLSKVLKNYVSYDFVDDDNDFSGENTVFRYQHIIGEESVQIWNATDNAFVDGNVAWISTVQPPFQIGDIVSVTPEIREWTYNDNAFVDGDVGFTGSIAHDFKVGDEITITNQVTNPQYNGSAIVTDVINGGLTVKTNIPWGVSSPVEGGIIYGQAWRGYERTVAVTDVYQSGGDWYVVTDKGWIADTNGALPAELKYADGRISERLLEDTSSFKYVLNSSLDKDEYTETYFTPFLIDSSSGNLTSTILSKDLTKRYRIEKSTKSWLLGHYYYTDTATKTMDVALYDSSDSLIQVSTFTLTGTYRDRYTPIGLDQLVRSSMTVNNPIAPIIDDVAYYSVRFSNTGVTRNTEYITFEVNNDCSRYDIYHLCWLDSFGSWLSYPFIYQSKESTEIERSSYYQTEGKFDRDNDTFGYSDYEGGEQVFTNRTRDSIILNSGWIKDFENDLIKDLLRSTKVFIQEPDNTMKQVVIQNDNFKFKNTNNDNLYQYSLTVKYNDTKTNY